MKRILQLLETGKTNLAKKKRDFGDVINCKADVGRSPVTFINVADVVWCA